MKQIFGAMVETAEELNRIVESIELDPKTNRATVEVTDIFARYTTDVIAKTAFGLNANSLRDTDDEFRKFGRDMFDFHWYRAIEMTCIFLYPQMVPWFRFKVD